ncbi:hypothetical protein K439DRAFT_1641225 [Ramaria rubella]|nr:hypothetical protein K439DRAFT_1641225 [Ramaria rubella]
MLSINSLKSVPALVPSRSGRTSTTSTTPTSTAPTTPGESVLGFNLPGRALLESNKQPLPLSESESPQVPVTGKRADMKLRLWRLRQSTQALLHKAKGNSKFKIRSRDPSVTAVACPCPVLEIEFSPNTQLIRDQMEPIFSHNYGYALRIPMPSFPSQASLIPLHDGSVLPSPEEEHGEKETMSFTTLACLAGVTPINPNIDVKSDPLPVVTFQTKSPYYPSTGQILRPWLLIFGGAAFCIYGIYHYFPALEVPML